MLCGNRPGVVALSDQIDNRPMILSTLKQIGGEFRQFTSPEQAKGKGAERAALPFWKPDSRS